MSLSEMVFWDLSPNLHLFKEPRNRFQGIDSASLCSLAAGYNNLIGRIRPAKLHAGGINASESIPGLLGFPRVYKYGLRIA